MYCYVCNFLTNNFEVHDVYSFKALLLEMIILEIFMNFLIKFAKLIQAY